MGSTVERPLTKPLQETDLEPLENKQLQLELILKQLEAVLCDLKQIEIYIAVGFVKFGISRSSRVPVQYMVARSTVSIHGAWKT